MPGAAHGDVMRALSKRWAEWNEAVKAGEGAGVDHEMYWKAVGRAAKA